MIHHTYILRTTDRFCRDELVMLDGRVLPMSPFLTSVRVPRNFAMLKRLSGSVVIAVDSKCRVPSDVHEVKLFGSVPAK